jgi:MFS family permease
VIEPANFSSSPTQSAASTGGGFAAAFHSRAFRVLWFSEAVSLIGDRILMVALINLVYELSGSAAAVGLLSMIKALPALALAAVAGVFVDRWSRKWIMVISNLILAGLVLVIPLTGALPVIFAVYLAMSVVSQFFIPARSATIPDLVPAGALTAANALFAAAFVGAIAIGPAVGSWISDRYGLRTAFIIDALTFLAPAAAVSLLTIPTAARHGGRVNLGADWREGLALLKAEAVYRSALLLLSMAALLIAALSALGVMVVREKFSGSAADFGWMMSITGAGMLTGALTVTRVGARFERMRLSSCGVVLAGLAMTGIALAPRLPLVMACGFLLGIGIIAVQVQTQTTLQGAPEALRGRMLGMGQAVMGSMTFLIAGCAGLLAARFGTSPVLLVTGLASALTGLAVLLFSNSLKSATLISG